MRPRAPALKPLAILTLGTALTAQGYPLWTSTSPALPVHPSAGTGDIDGDGVRDLLRGPVPLSGGPIEVVSGRDGIVLRTLAAPAGSAAFGYALAPFPDADGDGVADILAGDLRATVPGTGLGSVLVVSSATGMVLERVSAPAGAQEFGIVVAAVSDLDADGTADILAAATTPSQVVIASGRTGLPLRTLAGTGPFDGYGASVLDAGDVDGDGVAEIAIGVTEPGNSLDPPFVPTGTGYVELRSGATGGLLWVSRGAAVRDAFGSALARVHDVDGDGLPDLLAGAPQRYPCSDMTCYSGAGYASVLSARTGAVLLTVNGTGTAAQFGASVTAMPDVDGDDVDDFAVGAPGDDNYFYVPFPGVVHVFSGADGTGIANAGTAPDLFAGRDVIALGDADGDGVPDVASGPRLDARSLVGIANGDLRVGTACAGAGGRAPTLATYGGTIDASGNARFGFAVSQGRANAPTALLLGTATNPAGVSFGGCRVHAGGTIVAAVPAATLSSNGHRFLPTPVPVLPPATAGSTLTWQGLVLDAASPNGLFSVTEAVVTTVR